MRMFLFFVVLFLSVSGNLHSQQTMRKLADKPIIKKVGNYTFKSNYEPYFINDYYYSVYGADDYWFYDFKDGNLIVNRVKEYNGTVKEIRKWEIDLLRLDTNSIYSAFKNYGGNTGKKKYKNLGTIETMAGDKFTFDANGGKYEGEGKWVDMDFESFSQFISFWFEFKYEWRKAAAESVHIKALQAMDATHLSNYNKPYIISLLNDSSFSLFKAELPYILRGKLVIKFRSQPLYNLIILSEDITRKVDFINEYYKYDTWLNRSDSNDVIPLMLSVAFRGDTNVVKHLLKLGASPFYKNKENKTAYDYALYFQKQQPAYENIIRNALFYSDYPLQTKLQFCTDYKLINEGAKLLDEAAMKYPDSLQLQYQNASWSYNMRQYAQAAKAFTQCIRLNREEARFYFNRGLCYYVLKMNNQAENDFTEAINRKPSYKTAVEEAKKQVLAANQ